LTSAFIARAPGVKLNSSSICACAGRKIKYEASRPLTWQ
jgi:hypothetical protein